VYCGSLSQNFDLGINVHLSANSFWAWADWDIGLDISDGMFNNLKNQVDCFSKVMLYNCSIAKSVSINFGMFIWQELWR
jgi:hypothetical protein